MPPRASSRRRPSRRPTSSSSAGAGEPPAAATARARPSSRRRSTRSSATRRATSPSSSSAGRRTSGGSSSRSAADPHAELALHFADAIARHHDAIVTVLHLVPPGITLAVRAQAERALAAFIKQHIAGKSEAVLREAPNVRNAILREAEKADLVVMGASTQAGGADGETYLFGALPEAIAARARPTVMVVKTRETVERGDVRPAGRARRDARRGRPGRRGGARRPGPGRALVRRVELPPRRVRRPAPARDAQGEAEADGQPRAADAQRGGDDRADRPAGDARDGRPGAAARRGPRHRLGVDGSHPRDRRGRGRAGRAASRHPAPLRLVHRQGRGALEVGLRGERRHHRVGRHGREELAPADGLRDARAAAPRAAAAVRQGLLPAPDRRGRRPQGGRRRPGHGARRPAPDQPVLPGAVGDDPAAGRASTRAAGRCWRRSRSSRATRSRSGTSSTPPSGSASRGSGRSTSSGGSTATRSSRACRGCRS